MKILATLIFVLFIGVIAQAQNANAAVSVDVAEITGSVESIS